MTLYLRAQCSNIIVRPWHLLQDGLALLRGSNPAWRNEADCGEASFAPAALNGSVATPTLELNCAGPSHALFVDADGALLGAPGALAGAFAAVAGRAFPYDQGTPLAAGPCSLRSTDGNAYMCEANSSEWAVPPMLPELRPSPTPAAGVFGDPQLFVFESRDADSETRNFGPLLVNVSGRCGWRGWYAWGWGRCCVGHRNGSTAAAGLHHTFAKAHACCAAPFPDPKKTSPRYPEQHRFVQARACCAPPLSPTPKRPPPGTLNSAHTNKPAHAACRFSFDSVDVLVPPMDHGWCFHYTCGRRISNFHTFVPTGGPPVEVSFTGSPPRFSRMWMPNADDGAELVVTVKFADTLRRCVAIRVQRSGWGG
eukprot:362766-Chlamydomonas_euryale.AAC.3